ncbi:MAG TPA: TetR/AcrR family transcriptional regulator [Vicinamibacterales bacterium]|nr:TetR/AcrR family transcriptional regulator [Vicinamibacterales bacterium]
MFTNIVKARRPGRPAGETAQGTATRARLYAIAMDQIGTRGYEATTLRDIAAKAGVSVGLLYRYFPSKQSIVMALYDQLSADYAARAAAIPEGRWRDRFLFALQESLDVLRPHRAALTALTPVLVGDPTQGIFSNATAPSRLRVQAVFEFAVADAMDAPKQPLAGALGRLLYLVHLAVLLWWLLDRSVGQRTTRQLETLISTLLPSVAVSLRLPMMRRFVSSLDQLIGEGLLAPTPPD